MKYRLVLAAAALASTATGAFAQYGYYPGLPFAAPRPYYGDAPVTYEGRSGYAPRYCEKLCTQDTSPCDPPEFKRADGRCTNPVPRL